MRTRGVYSGRRRWRALKKNKSRWREVRFLNYTPHSRDSWNPPSSLCGTSAEPVLRPQQATSISKPVFKTKQSSLISLSTVQSAVSAVSETLSQRESTFQKIQALKGGRTNATQSKYRVNGGKKYPMRGYHEIGKEIKLQQTALIYISSLFFIKIPAQFVQIENSL